MLRYVKSQAGFTFIEMMVALAVAAIVMGAIVQLFGQTLRVREQVERKTDVQMAVRHAMDDITGEVKYCKQAVADGKILKLTAYDDSSITYERKDNRLVKSIADSKGATKATRYINNSELAVSAFTPQQIEKDKVNISIQVGRTGMGSGKLEETLETTVSVLPHQE